MAKGKVKKFKLRMPKKKRGYKAPNDKSPI